MLHLRDPTEISNTNTGDTDTDGVDQLDYQDLNSGLILLEIHKDLKGIHNKFDIMERRVNQLKSENEELKKNSCKQSMTYQNAKSKLNLSQK
ncbi:hypothetical protein DPMN_095732 [Dreissena polymorpha]|uniref:Uncharacterized protein n=1 Tax=Dreissena polymorpha TaxID=45954 RepID=A0A9D4L861_DREPO|nr:hypothetical protein DPMN_095732 [Dreissena polymorpha]